MSKILRKDYGFTIRKAGHTADVILEGNNDKVYIWRITFPSGEVEAEAFADRVRDAFIEIFNEIE